MCLGIFASIDVLNFVLTGEEAFVGEGNTFYLGFFSNFFPGDFFTRADTRLLVGVNEGEGVRFTVEARGRVTTYTTSRGLPTEIDLDNTLRLSSIQTRDKGIFVRSLQGEALSVVALAEEFTSVDSFKVLPCVYLPDSGYEYYAVSVPILRVELDYEEQYDGPEFLDPLGNSAIVIVASEDDTIITLNLTRRVDISAAGDLVDQIGANAIEAGRLVTLILNRMQTLYISSLDDLTGSRVVSDKPIAFISGHECGTLPSNLLFCDQLVEQIPPTSTWGRRFITTSIASRTQYDMFKVVASRDGTVFSGQCTSSGDQLLMPVMASLARGEVAALQIASNQSCYFEANNPVLLIQFSVSSNVDGVINADPFMVIIPPVEQYRTSYEIGTFQSSAVDGANYLNILLPETESTCILLNDSCISTAFTAIPCLQNSSSICARAVQVAVPPGTHSLANEDPQVAFSVVAYWHSFRVSHGYFGGATQRPIACESAVGLPLPGIYKVSCFETTHLCKLHYSCSKPTLCKLSQGVAAQLYQNVVPTRPKFCLIQFVLIMCSKTFMPQWRGYSLLLPRSTALYNYLVIFINEGSALCGALVVQYVEVWLYSE